MPSWFESDEFWETFRAVMFHPRRVEQAPAEIESVVKLLGIAPGTSVLDMCSGVGRHSIELARRGFKVTGVDRTAPYLERARRRAERESLSIEFVQSDIRDFRREGAFDGAINMFTSFGYFEDPNDDLKAARNLATSLRGGARLVMDVLGKEVLARRYLQRRWEAELDDGTILLSETRLRDGWGWAESRWILIRGSERNEFTFGHRLYSGTELRQVLKSAGFAEVDLYGSLAGTAYDHEAERLVAVARR